VSFLAVAAVAALARPPQDDRVSVIFAPTGEKRSLEDRIAREIRAAEHDVCVAMFHFTSDRLLRALADRRRAGVAVAVLLDASQADDDLLDRLRAADLSVRRVTPRDEGARFHHKFSVIDGKTVITGSYNWTILGDIANHENVLILRNEGTARAYRDEFERVWQSKDLSRP
jgi:phosphatidylserine/phosphatidylglycerophosphate/cardiolipin synthase-like enzyme